MNNKHCEWCDTQFKPRVSYQIYCSPECRQEATREKILERYVQLRTQRRAGKKRYCKSCNTLLSMYNDSTICQSCEINPSDVMKALKEMKGLGNDKGK